MRRKYEYSVGYRNTFQAVDPDENWTSFTNLATTLQIEGRGPCPFCSLILLEAMMARV